MSTLVGNFRNSRRGLLGAVLVRRKPPRSHDSVRVSEERQHQRWGTAGPLTAENSASFMEADAWLATEAGKR